MKRIYYLLACVVVAAFSACNPLDKTYKQLGDLPTPSTIVTANLTLANADYGLLPTGNPAKTSFYFKTEADAKTGIPAILASKYPNYGEKSAITVTYATAPISVKPADSLFANVNYVFGPADYALINPAYTNLSAAQIITWLGIKYPVASNPENKLAVLTFNFFDQGASSIVTQSFMIMGGAWTKIYHITAAQYASIGKGGNNNDFVAADAALLPSYFNTFLKADPSVSVTAKAGDIKYVSYKYFGGGTFQRVAVLTYNGTNWTTTSSPATLIFAKTNGAWVPDNTVRYTLVKDDYTFISNIPGVGSDAATGNLRSFGNFNIQGGATTWKDDEINSGIATWLKSKYTTAVKDQKFVITYSAYNGANITPTKTFQYNGTAFVYVP